MARVTAEAAPSSVAGQAFGNETTWQTCRDWRRPGGIGTPGYARSITRECGITPCAASINRRERQITVCGQFNRREGKFFPNCVPQINASVTVHDEMPGLGAERVGQMAGKHRRKSGRTKKIAAMSVATVTATALTVGGVTPTPEDHVNRLAEDVDLMAAINPWPAPGQIPDLTGGLGQAAYGSGQAIADVLIRALVENLNAAALAQAAGLGSGRRARHLARRSARTATREPSRQHHRRTPDRHLGCRRRASGATGTGGGGPRRRPRGRRTPQHLGRTAWPARTRSQRCPEPLGPQRPRAEHRHRWGALHPAEDVGCGPGLGAGAAEFGCQRDQQLAVPGSRGRALRHPWLAAAGWAHRHRVTEWTGHHHSRPRYRRGPGVGRGRIRARGVRRRDGLRAGGGRPGQSARRRTDGVRTPAARKHHGAPNDPAAQPRPRATAASSRASIRWRDCSESTRSHRRPR